MRTALIIEDSIFRELKRLAVDQKRTLSDVTQEALRRGLAERTPSSRRRRVRLPSFALGRPRVDLADRNHLFDALDRP